MSDGAQGRRRVYSNQKAMNEEDAGRDRATPTSVSTQ